MKEALLLIHPHYGYDQGITEETVLEVLESFEGDKYCVYSESNSRCDRPYGDSVAYTDIFPEDKSRSVKKGKGFPDQEEIEKLLQDYDHIRFGGGYLNQCLKASYLRFEESRNEIGQDTDFSIAPEITYYQTGMGKMYTGEHLMDVTGEEYVLDCLEPLKPSFKNIER